MDNRARLMELAVAGGITGSGVRPLQIWVDPSRSATNVRPRPNLNRGSNATAAWLALIGLIIPAADVQIYVANAKFTAGRIGVILLLFPAIIKLCQRSRRAILCDFFASAAASWMIIAALYTEGLPSLGSAGAESLEFLGGYVVARAYVFGPAALNSFIGVLKVLAIIAILLGIADTISGRLFIHETIASILQVRPPDAQDREFLGTITVRAMSTFDHAILFGAFCSLVAAITLYSERNVARRVLFVAFCLLGTVLAVSSAPLLGIAIALTVYTYDHLLRRYSWRWTALWTTNVTVLLIVFVVTNHPLSWLISHLTLEPLSGYFRIMEWDLAMSEMANSPLTGYAFNHNFSNLLDVSVDTVWIAFALRFGLPMIMFLFLANVTACLPTRHSFNSRTGASFTDSMRTAFTLVLFLFMFMGLTVHYWNYMWIFWGLCLGIRASLREESIGVASRSVSSPPAKPLQARSRWPR